MSKIIEIVVSPEGRTTVQTSGFTGSACREASKTLEEALGQRISENLTAEFYQTAQAKQQLQQGA